MKALMIDLNDVSFTLPVLGPCRPVTQRCPSTEPAVRCIRTPVLPFCPKPLHDSLDALATELEEPNGDRISIICATLESLAEEIEYLPKPLDDAELASLLQKVEQLTSVVDSTPKIEVPTAVKILHRKILTPSSTWKHRTLTPRCPQDIQDTNQWKIQNSSPTHIPNTRRFLFP